MKNQDVILQNEKEVLEFLKSRFPFYHLSNVFFRDLQYGIRAFGESRTMTLSYSEGEALARAFVEQMEKKKIFVRIDAQTWALHYPEFKTPVTKAPPPPPAPKPAPAAPTVAA